MGMLQNIPMLLYQYVSTCHYIMLYYVSMFQCVIILYYIMSVCFNMSLYFGLFLDFCYCYK